MSAVRACFILALLTASCATTGPRFLLDCSMAATAECYALADRDCPAGYEVVSSVMAVRSSLTGAGLVTLERRHIVVECREGR